MTQKKKHDDSFEDTAKQIEAVHPMTEAYRADIKSQAILYSGWTVLPILFVFLFVCVNLGDAARVPTSTSCIPCMILMGSGFVLGFGFLILNKWLQVFDDLRSGTVNSIEGKIALDVKQNWNGTNYELRVVRKRFTVRKNLFLSLSNHQAYRVFYAPQSRVVVGVEPL